MCSSTEGHLGCSHIHAASNVGAQLSEDSDVTSFRFSPEGDCWTVVPFLVFRGASVLFSGVAASVCIPPSRARGLPFVRILATLTFAFLMTPLLNQCGKLIDHICMDLLLSSLSCSIDFEV